MWLYRQIKKPLSPAKEVGEAKTGSADDFEKNIPDPLKEIIIQYVGADFGDSNAISLPNSDDFNAHLPFFITTKDARKYNRAQAIAFLQHIVQGEEKKAKEMLQNNSALLFCTEVVTDYSGRRIKGTAYQIALGAEDIEMARMIRPFFTIAYKNNSQQAEEEIKRQYDKQFTSESQKIHINAAHTDREALYQVIQAIRKATPEDCQFLLDPTKSEEGEVKEIVAKLKEFRTYLDSKTEEVITSGKHFNADLLDYAFQEFYVYYTEFGGCYSPKNGLFWKHVIGYIERYLPACYAQAFCSGICHIPDHKGRFIRSFQYPVFSPESKSFRSHSLFPLSSEASGLGLGYEYAACPLKSSERHWHFPSTENGTEKIMWFFKSYVVQKERDAQLMRGDPPKRTTTTCALI